MASLIVLIATSCNDEKNNDGFVQVHKEKVPVAPILMAKQKGSKPRACVPWKQKLLVHMDDIQVLQVVPYHYENEMRYLIFTHSAEGDNEGFMKMYEYVESNEKPKLVFKAEEKSYASLMYSNFIVKDGKIKFHYTDKNYERIYREYILGSESTPEYVYGSSKWLYESPFYNHKRSAHIRTDMYYKDNDVTALIKTNTRTQEEEVLFTLQNTDVNWLIGDISWSEDNKVIYFDNASERMACIWRYELLTGVLEKIVPEHEAKYPYVYTYKGKEYVAYVENNEIKLATR